MKKLIILVTAVFAASFAIILGTIGWEVGHSTGSASTTGQMQVVSAGTPQAHLYLTVATPDQLGTEVGPAYLPGNPIVPANADVTVTIFNFDDATPLTGAAVKYATATGIVGSASVETFDPANPNGPAKDAAREYNALDPATVSHTFTIPDLNVNVPLAPHSRTTFTFHTGAAGTFTFRCMDPCGPGTTGWGGAMSQDGFMSGKLTVA